MAGIWSTRDNPNQTFTVALTLAIRSAPDQALARLAYGTEKLHEFTKEHAKKALRDRGFEVEGGVGKLPCDDCGKHVRIRKPWFSKFVCLNCFKLIRGQWSRRRVGRAGRKPKEAENV